MVALLLFVVVVVASTVAAESVDSRLFCESYVECAAVALLEERLCIGNSRLRPYWLPEKHDPKKCHEKLKNDYVALERLEEELDGQMNACLIENFTPQDDASTAVCTYRTIRDAPKFAAKSGPKRRTIVHVPTQCFTGVQRRVERECAHLANCCNSLAKCKSLNSESNLQKIAQTTRENLRKRAADCEKGHEIVPLPVEDMSFSSDDEASWAPKGHVNVNFRHLSGNDDVGSKPHQPTGFVNVRFKTKGEVEDRASRILIRKGDVVERRTRPELVFPRGNEEANELHDVFDNHDAAFANALRNTNAYKEKLREWDRTRLVKQEIDSLLDAASASSAVAMGTVTPSVDFSDDDEKPEIFTSVVSNPVIFVSKNTSLCNTKKSQKLMAILALLGEKENSKDMKQIRKLVDEWEADIGKSKLPEKQSKRAKEIETKLEELLKNFDRVDFDSLRKNVTGDDCSSLAESNDDVLVIQQDVPTLVLSSNIDDVVNEKPTETDDGDMKSFVSDEYRQEIEKYRKEHQIWGPSNTTLRNETTCDLYLRCRNQMNVAVDGCAWRFASEKLLATMAESAESLLYKDDAMCDEKDEESYVKLYEGVIRRNKKLRECLETKNKVFFEESVCMAYSKEQQEEFDQAMLRLLVDEYKRSTDCFHDANLIQEKCTKLRDCCPNFDKCREETMEPSLEMEIISTTAHINQRKQDCIKLKAKNAFKEVIREILTNGARETLKRIKNNQLRVDISRGARVVRMAQHRGRQQPTNTAPN